MIAVTKNFLTDRMEIDMDWLISMVTNAFLITGVSSWAIAQVLKVVIHACIQKKFDIMRLFGDGGMPSGHSATVTSVAVLSALVYGTGSFEFAISALLAIIVCHDAMGVRRETGKQAVVINELLQMFDDLATKEFPEGKLKEFVGHSPIQVAAGILIGIANAFLMYVIFYGAV